MGDPFVKSYIQGSDKVQRRRGRGLGSQTERVCASVSVCASVFVCTRVRALPADTQDTSKREEEGGNNTQSFLVVFFLCVCRIVQICCETSEQRRW